MGANLSYILKELDSIKINNKYIKKAIEDRKQFYTETGEKLETLPYINIVNYDFLAEVLRKAESLEKLKFIPNLLDKVTKLETHEYSPEQNKLHFKDKYISVPQAKTIAEAITQIIENNSKDNLKKILIRHEYSLKP